MGKKPHHTLRAALRTCFLWTICIGLLSNGGCAAPSMKSCLVYDYPRDCERFLQRANDPALFTKVALEGAFESADAALRNIREPSLLAQVALEAKHEKVRANAAERLTDQTILFRIARTDPVFSVRSTALERLTDQEALSSIIPAMAAEVSRLVDPKPLVSAISRSTDQSMLAELAVASTDKEVALAALKSMTDQALLGNLARPENPEYVRLNAIANLKDRTLLSKIAQGIKVGSHDHDDEIAQLRLFLLDPAIEEHVGTTSLEVFNNEISLDYGFRDVKVYTITAEHIKVRVSGGMLQKIHEVEWKAEFPRETSSSQHRRIFVRVRDVYARLLDAFPQNGLLSIASANEDPNARRAAIEMLDPLLAENQAVLTGIVVNDQNEFCRAAAAKILADQALLVEVVKKDGSSFVRQGALEGLTNQELLARIVLEDDRQDVRLRAVGFLRGSAQLLRILHDPNTDDQVSAIARIRFFQLDPVIEEFFGKTTLYVRYWLRNGSHWVKERQVRAYSEEVAVYVYRDGNEIARHQWESSVAMATRDGELVRVTIEPKDIYAALLRGREMTKTALATVAVRAGDPEVRELARIMAQK